MPLSIVISNLVKFAVQFLLFLSLTAYYALSDANIAPTIYILLFPLIILLMAAQGLGLGMIISAMTTKYRDLAFLVTFGVQLLMYATTVIYPLSEAKIQYPQYSWIIEYNPMTVVIEAFRYGFLGKGTFDLELLTYSTLVTVFLLLAGTFTFNKVERNFVDTI